MKSINTGKVAAVQMNSDQEKEVLLRINMRRLMETLEISNQVGSLPEGGLCRLALSDEDKVMRDHLCEWMTKEGLDVRFDDFGNIYGRREGRIPDAAPVLIGSHLDTQPEGGRYDGILGVLAALEVIRTLNERGIETERPIEVVNFTNEEGARFEPPMLGSGGIASLFRKEYIYGLKDKDGKYFGDELQRIGYVGEKKNRIEKAHRYVELHIEQGPLLENQGISIGAVEGVQGMTWLEVTLEGSSSHAGTTPMELRKDALQTACKIIHSLPIFAHEVDSETLVTVGRMQISPHSVNSVPGKVVFSVDIRHFDDTIRRQAVEFIQGKITMLATCDNIQVKIYNLWDIDATRFSPDVIEMIEQASQKYGYPYRRIVSGAGHDAKYINDSFPSGMIFVPSAGGRSHCQDEFTSQEDIEKGVNILLYVTLNLANQKLIDGGN
ncbi:Zn-dependent hydrolase [Bacillus sp. JJ1532]|uniref:Zn-dependent hydrolase n=1 Tax=Bacillus sp. JJ1532 TaxID=3122958 RepID=UPI002FFFBD4B